MPPDPGRDIQDRLIAAMSLDERIAISTRLRDTGLLLAWQQSDAAGPANEVERARFLIDRLYPRMPAGQRAQILASLADDFEAGRWCGFERPGPLAATDG